jgi:hypothetical protein
MDGLSIHCVFPSAMALAVPLSRAATRGFLPGSSARGALQGMAQVVHCFVDLRRAIMAAQRAFADVDAHAHTLEGNGLLAKNRRPASVMV